MTDEQKAAGEALEEAIRAWYRASYPDDNDLVVSWVLLTETMPIDGPAGRSVVAISSSDGMTLASQLGLIDYAQTLARDYVTRPPDED